MRRRRGIEADGADLLREIDGELGRHGGIPVTELLIATSGYHLSSFISYAPGSRRGSTTLLLAPRLPVLGAPSVSDTRRALRSAAARPRGCGGRGVGTLSRAGIGARTPGAVLHHDVLDAGAVPRSPPTSTHSFAPRGAAMRSRCCRGWSRDAARAIGFLPDENDAAPALLAKMCGRCHGASTDRRLARARFDATALERWTRPRRAKVVDRIALPRTSPDRMPPLRSGELPDWAIARITEFLRTAAPAESVTAL